MTQPLEMWRSYRLPDDLKEKIEGLAQIMKENEQEGIENRRMSKRIYDAFTEAGLFKLALVKEVGGLELHPVTEMEVYEAVARISVTACWNLLVGNIHTAWASAYLSDAAIKEIFPEGHQTVVAGQGAPSGSAKAAPGGLRVTGRYSWGSGISHASWALAGAQFNGEAIICVVPKSAVEVLDNWHVIGIEGSGSYDYKVDDLFVPEGFWFGFPAPVRRRGGSRYTAVLNAQATVPHSAVALGGCEHALEAIAALAAGKRRALSSSVLAERGAFQRDLGAAYIQVTAARDNAARLFENMSVRTEKGPPLTPAELAELTSMAASACNLAVDVSAMAFRYGGGSAVRLDSPLQRVLRDVLVAQQHVAVADSNFELLGQAIINACA